MLRNIAITLLLFSAIPLHSQDFFSVDQSWTYRMASIGSRDYLRMTVDRDTIITDQLCHVITSKVYRFFVDIDTGERFFADQYDVDVDLIVRDSMSYISHRYNDTWVPMYWLDAVVGESITVGGVDSFRCRNQITGAYEISNESVVEVIDINVVEVDDIPLTFINTSPTMSWSYPNNEIIKELGSLYSFLPRPTCNGDDLYESISIFSISDNLVCYSDNDLSLVLEVTACTDIDLLLSSDGISHNESAEIMLFPNPARDFVNLSYGDQNPGTFHIYDLDGQLLLSENVHPEYKLDLSGLSAGLYIASLQTSSRRYPAQKLIVAE